MRRFGRDGFAILIHVDIRRRSVLKRIVDFVNVVVVVTPSRAVIVVIVIVEVVEVWKVEVVHGVVALQRRQRW